MSVSQVSECLSCPDEAGLGVLLPHLAPVVVEKTEVGPGLVRIFARARADGAACPKCGTWSAVRHGSYTRTLADAPAGGRRVLIRLRTRLLRCGNGGCPVRTFAEQPAGLAVPRARKTPLLAAQLTAVAAALAGRAGCRLASTVLAVEVSRHTLIRMLTALPDPPAAPVRVLGIDDFSLRRGATYATLLVDMETGVPVDVLPDREQATVEDWLRAHPGAEVICRDRGGAYAAAAAAAAPQAVQVADRWHLWHNLCGYARQAIARHRDCARTGSCRHRHEHGGEQDGQPGGPGDEESREPRAAQENAPADLETVIRQRHAAVRQLRAAGKTLPQAAEALGLDEHTAGRFWRAATAGSLLTPDRPAACLQPWKAYLRQRWAQGATVIKELHAEITALGYTGSYTTTYSYASMFRLATPARPARPPTTRQITGWLLRDPATLDPSDQDKLAAIRARCPAINTLDAHVTAFAKILRGRHGDRLDAWMTAVDTDPGQPGLHSFTHGIRQDYQAVRNALTHPWSSGPVEGLNTRTKLLKRQMYGRASFPLLRKRILLAS